MSLFRWAGMAVIAGVAGFGAPSTAAAPPVAKTATVAKPAPKTAKAGPNLEHESEPRVEIGPAVLYLYDESGRIIAVE